MTVEWMSVSMLKEKGYKRCNTCGRKKSLKSFHRAACYKDGHRPYCKPCKKVEAKKYYARIKGPELIERNKLYVRKVKKECIDAYGGKCRCCGETILDFLSLDHIKDDGFKERTVSGGSGYAFYMKLKKLGYPHGNLQPLCHNCQWGKRISKGFCPHHPDIDLRTVNDYET